MAIIPEGRVFIFQKSLTFTGGNITIGFMRYFVLRIALVAASLRKLRAGTDNGRDGCNWSGEEIRKCRRRLVYEGCQEWGIGTHQGDAR